MTEIKEGRVLYCTEVSCLLGCYHFSASPDCQKFAKLTRILILMDAVVRFSHNADSSLNKKNCEA